MARKLISILLLAAGIGVFLYPEAASGVQRVETERYISRFEEQNTETRQEDDPRYMESLEYNSRIAVDGQAEFSDAWICTQSPVSLEGFEDGKYGYISIPAMDVKLPLYLGASEANMKKGAAVLGGTSLPTGGADTNCVIAAHRGYAGKPYFREIEKLEAGDQVIVRNPWERLEYTVEDIRIIDPYDSEALRIQEGKDMVTLLTCHPYRSHGRYRYAVFCRRMAEKGEKPVESKSISVVRTQDIEEEKRFRMTCGVAMVVLGTAVVIGTIRKE